MSTFSSSATNLTPNAFDGHVSATKSTHNGGKHEHHAAHSQSHSHSNSHSLPRPAPVHDQSLKASVYDTNTNTNSKTNTNSHGHANSNNNSNNHGNDSNLQHHQNAASNGNDKAEQEHEGMQGYLYRLCHRMKKDIKEVSRENGRPLTDTSRYFLWNLRNAFAKVNELPSDAKIAELVSLHFHTQPIHTYHQKMYFYLDIQLNTNECIHVRILHKDLQQQEIQTILYKTINDKMSVF